MNRWRLDHDEPLVAKTTGVAWNATLAFIARAGMAAWNFALHRGAIPSARGADQLGHVFSALGSSKAQTPRCVDFCALCPILVGQGMVVACPTIGGAGAPAVGRGFAAWTALTQQMPRRFTTIYSPQLNAAVDEWVLAGRQRFGQPEMVARLDGAKPIVAAVRRGEPLYLLPDMNFDPSESLFVPFYGVSAATVPSLSRFAKLGRAQVVPILARLSPRGYTIQVLPAWQDFPSDDMEADTRRMNQELQAYIDSMPAQYYWVHKRFKDRPNGETPPY